MLFITEVFKSAYSKEERTNQEIVMAFNPEIKKTIVCDRETGEHLPCLMCGRRCPTPDAVHIIDEKEWKGNVGCDRQLNGIPLCPNCHRTFDEVLRPYLYRALKEFGSMNLPTSWQKSNKLTRAEEGLNRNASDDG